MIFTKTGRVAATANYSSNLLNFNQVLLDENTEDFIKQTVPHEVAHLIAGTVFPKIIRRMVEGRIIKGSPHGKEWATIMRMLGANPNRCHNYDISSVVRKRITFDYRCDGCGRVFPMGKIRHKRQLQCPEKSLYFHCPDGKLVWVDSGKS